jgi:hypothetical protein
MTGTQAGFTALVPAHNESEAIVATVEALRGIDAVARVLVIDDGSTDDTARRAAGAGADVLRCGRNLGKGAALQRGADALAAPQGLAGPQGLVEPQGPRGLAGPQGPPEGVLLLDGDLGASAAQAQVLLEPVQDGLADMTIGILPKPPGSGGFGVVKDLARVAIRDWGGGYDAQAPLSGQRALTWECFQALLPFAEGYGVEVALTIRALQRNLRVLEVMVDMRHRATGRDLPGFLHRAKQYLDIRRTIRQLSS